MCQEEINNHENNDLCKQRLVIVLRLHIILNVILVLHISSLTITVFRETVIWKIKGENCDGMDFKMGVAATLPELVNGL